MLRGRWALAALVIGIVAVLSGNGIITTQGKCHDRIAQRQQDQQAQGLQPTDGSFVGLGIGFCVYG